MKVRSPAQWHSFLTSFAGFFPIFSKILLGNQIMVTFCSLCSSNLSTVCNKFSRRCPILWLLFVLVIISQSSLPLYLLISANLGLVFFLLTPMSLSSMLIFCFRDPIASIFFESMEIYFSEFLSWSLNCSYSFTIFFSFFYVQLSLHANSFVVLGHLWMGSTIYQRIA
jgi:hypothetical protein